MRGIRLNIGTPWVFIIVGLFGGQVQRRRSDGTYGDEWTWLSVEPPMRRSLRPKPSTTGHSDKTIGESDRTEILDETPTPEHTDEEEPR